VARTRTRTRARARAREASWRSRLRSATILNVSEHPRCAASLHAGKQCRAVAIDGTEFCQYHGGLVGDHGAEALKRGDHLPAPRTHVEQAAVVAEEAMATTESGNGTGTVDPSLVRPRLAEAAAASLEDIRRVLLETATGANKNLWATINCKHCGRAGRYEITVPDNKVRLDAIQALLQESLGRPGQAEAQPVPALPASVEQVRKLSWDQMTLVFASQFADEIGSVVARGDGLLRERLDSLGPDERHILREALAEPELI